MNGFSPELEAKRDALVDLLRGYGRCVVAFSGGLDSTVLAKAARIALGENALAVTGVSASLAAGEFDECVELARLIGIRHEVIQTDELSNPDYQRNQADRCFHCKTELFSRLDAIAREYDDAVVCDGSNLDDHGEHRPGIQAARKQRVRSPLAETGLTKDEIRQLAACWELPTWDKPATPCLSSRIAYGEEVTAERLAMVDAAERLLRELGFQPLRVRYHKGDMARIEVAPEAVARLAGGELRARVVERLKEIGFKFVSVDLEGFRSGSLNTVLPADRLQVLGR